MTYCCEYFPKIAFQFNWFSYTDDNGAEIYLMPYLKENDGQKIRVNHCPVCGGEVRSITIPAAEFFKLTGLSGEQQLWHDIQEREKET